MDKLDTFQELVDWACEAIKSQRYSIDRLMEEKAQLLEELEACKLALLRARGPMPAKEPFGLT